jgi:dynein heavy chain
LFSTLLEVQPRVVGTEKGDLSMDKSVKRALNDILTNIRDPFNIQKLYDRIEKPEPEVSIFLQESERLNILRAEIKRSLTELDLDLSGELTISEPMDALMIAIYID